MGGFPHFRDVVFEGTFPTARLTFSEPRFPGKAVLDAWSPFVPLKACIIQTVSCRMWGLVSLPGFELRLPTLGAWSLSH